MSYIFLQEQGAVSSVDNFSDIPQSVLSKLKSTQDKSCCNDNETECCLSSPSGMMSAPLTEPHGEEQLMLFAEDSLAKTYPHKEKALESMVNAVDFGRNIKESLGKLNLSMSLLKTPRYCGNVGLTLSSETCPNWGMMQDGACWEVGTLKHLTKESVCGYWLPTPMAHNKKEGGYPAETRRNTPTLTYRVNGLNGGALHPNFTERMMGWPVDWTDLKPLAMDKILGWQQQHGEF